MLHIIGIGKKGDEYSRLLQFAPGFRSVHFLCSPQCWEWMSVLCPCSKVSTSESSHHLTIRTTFRRGTTFNKKLKFSQSKSLKMAQESLPEVDVIPNQLDTITKQEDKESMKSLLDVCDDRFVKALEKTPTVRMIANRCCLMSMWGRQVHTFEEIELGITNQSMYCTNIPR